MKFWENYKKISKKETDKKIVNDFKKITENLLGKTEVILN